MKLTGLEKFEKETGHKLKVRNNKPYYDGSFDFEGITSLPDNLTSNCSLYLGDTGITSLPDNLIVGGALGLKGTGITSLPDNLIVGCYLDLSGTGITSLPDNFTVGGSLDLRGTGITSLPDNLKVGCSLFLGGTGITSLPDNLTVGESLDLEGTGITDTSMVNRGSLNFIEWRNTEYIKVNGLFSKVISHKGNRYKITRLGETRERFLVTDGNGKWAHGDTLKGAKANLQPRKKMNIMEYGYEKRDYRGNLVYPMYPVQEGDAGNVIAAYIVGNGYTPVSPVTYESEEECRKACDVYNNFEGWTKGEVDAIFFKSITKQYPEETIELTK